MIRATLSEDVTGLWTATVETPWAARKIHRFTASSRDAVVAKVRQTYDWSDVDFMED